ncbi:MAG: glucose-1-phosphate adenylyltransferase subunit GlgD [Eubacteriales bacterium]|nr:glucose-1-phosphate adenylyltransferase subunit GlgD [Eubacteriales bacterium]
MKKNIVGLIYTGEGMSELKELTRYRSTAAMPMLGRYRLIDFILSVMIHSGMKNVGIIMQKNYHSLMDHLGSGREWNLHGKRSGMTILPPFMNGDRVGVYEGLLDALHSNLSFLRRSTERFIAVTDSNVLYQVNFEDILNEHLDKRNDITLLYSKKSGLRRNGSGRYLEVSDSGAVTKIEFDPTIPHFENTYIGAFLIRRELLIDLLDRSVAAGQHHFSRGMLAHMVANNTHRVGGFECPGNIWSIDSVPAYFKANMDFLNDSVRRQVFRDEQPIWTKLRDEMPARYLGEAQVKNALIADGCVIEGKVENSILFRGVRVSPGATVRNSIVMQDAVIHQGAELENCILDKQTTIREKVRLIAPHAYPIVVAKNLTI